MELDGFSRVNLFVYIGETRIAHRNDADGPALVLLHGCPFSSFVRRDVLPALAGSHRCVAPEEHPAEVAAHLGDFLAAPETAVSA
jgi:pimeloyl-ACP methyl ester carboxylesterase